MKCSIECWLSTPDDSTARRKWKIRFGSKRINLPIAYNASNKTMRHIEKFLEFKFWKYFDVGF